MDLMLCMPCDCGLTDDRVEWHIWNWEQWMRQKGIHIGHSSRASGGIGNSGSRDFDAMVAEADSRCAHAVDAIVEGLPSGQHAAVYHKHHLAVMRFPRGNLETLYAEACQVVRKGLVRRGIV